MRTFVSTFNNIGDFDLYTTPGDYNTWHELSRENVLLNDYSHKAYILGQNAMDNSGNEVHRGYWIKTLSPPYKGIIGMQLIVNADMVLSFRAGINDWWSPLTIGLGPGWTDLFTLAMGAEGYVYLQHVPYTDKQEWTYWNPVVFPYNKNVKFDLVIDTKPGGGEAHLYQDKVRTCSAKLRDSKGECNLLHGGLYCSPAVSYCKTYNSFFLIRELSRREDFDEYINADFENKLFPKATRYLVRGGIA